VHPPRLCGEATGLFACRTPHRPCPLGLSLVELRGVRHDSNAAPLLQPYAPRLQPYAPCNPTRPGVRGDELLLGGADLVDGTAVLDVKPCVAASNKLGCSLEHTWGCSLEHTGLLGVEPRVPRVPWADTPVCTHMLCACSAHMERAACANTGTCQRPIRRPVPCAYRRGSWRAARPRHRPAK